MLDNNLSTIATALPGDIIIAKGGNSLAKLGLLPEDFQQYALSRDLIVIRTSHLKRNKYFVWLFLHSDIGQDLLWRTASQTGQPHLTLPSIEQLTIPKYSEKFESLAEKLYVKSVYLKNESITKLKQAETLLLDALGMNNHLLDTNAVNVKTFKNSFASTGRLDAEYYQPKFEDLEKTIKNNSAYFKQIAEIQSYNSRGLQPEYFELGTLDVINSKHILDDHLDYDNFEKTSEESWGLNSKAHVFENDILIYTTGANIGRTNIYQMDKKALASNHVNILRINDEDPYYVSFVMNSFIGRMQTDKLSAGSAQAELYPKDIDQFIIPFVDKKIQVEIKEIIISSLALKRRSVLLLEIAKRSIEIAMDQDELTAIDYIKENS